MLVLNMKKFLESASKIYAYVHDCFVQNNYHAMSNMLPCNEIMHEDKQSFTSNINMENVLQQAWNANIAMLLNCQNKDASKTPNILC